MDFDKDALRESIIRHEGQKTFVYDDANGKIITSGTEVQGHPTIGIGRCLDTEGITSEEAEYLLNNDIEKVVNEVQDQIIWVTELSDARQRVLYEMTFQLGIHGLLAFKNTLSNIKAGQWQAAHDAMLSSKWAQQTPARAKELAEMILNG